MSQDIIGIVGCNGDLGSKMAVQAQSQFGEVMGFDIASSTNLAAHGIDHNVTPEDTGITRVRRLDILLHTCTVVHWCAPSATLDAVQAAHPDKLVILHDSVMSTSLRSAWGLQARTNSTAKIAIAHCLMNDQNKVVVASDYGATDEAFDHIKQLGLSPVLKSVQEHDHMMARSQAVLSVLVKTILPDLVAYEDEGMLTQSAHELLRSLQHRESRWTDATMTTMLRNLELTPLLDEFRGFIADHQSK